MRLYETIWDYTKLESYIRSQKIFLVSEYIEDVFSVTFFCLPRRLQDFFRTYLQDVFERCLQVMFARRLQDVFKKSSGRHLVNTSWRSLGREKDVTLKTFSGRLEDVFNRSSTRLHQDKCLLGYINNLDVTYVGSGKDNKTFK